MTRIPDIYPLSMDEIHRFLDAGEFPCWLQNMMGRETLKMILEHYYFYIRNYQRYDGSAFLENVYDPSVVEAEAKAWDKVE